MKSSLEVKTPALPEALVQLSTTHLRIVVAEALVEALADHEPHKRPALIDQAALARELGCSTRTIFTLRHEGMPTIMLGDAPRFELPVVLEWLRGRDAQTAGVAVTQERAAAVLPLTSRKRGALSARGFKQARVASNDFKGLEGAS